MIKVPICVFWQLVPHMPFSLTFSQFRWQKKDRDNETHIIFLRELVWMAHNLQYNTKYFTKRFEILHLVKI